MATILIDGGGLVLNEIHQSRLQAKATDALLRGCATCDKRKAASQHYKDWIAAQSVEAADEKTKQEDGGSGAAE